MNDLVEPGLGPPDAREIEINAGFDQTCGDQSAKVFRLQSLSDISEDRSTMHGILACRKVNDAIQSRIDRRAIERERMLPAIDDDQGLRMLRQRRNQSGIVECAGAHQRDPPQATSK
ncbi:MAG: hypothetical protein R3D03_04055 [Geminicoccaceae bacterium]